MTSIIRRLLDLPSGAFVRMDDDSYDFTVMTETEYNRCYQNGGMVWGYAPATWQAVTIHDNAYDAAQGIVNNTFQGSHWDALKALAPAFDWEGIDNPLPAGLEDEALHRLAAAVLDPEDSHNLLGGDAELVEAWGHAYPQIYWYEEKIYGGDKS